jgi:hypothetical protein
MTQTQFTASRKQRNGNTLTVTYIGSNRSDHQQAFHLAIDMAQVKKQKTISGNYLPGRFKAEGLPFNVEFVVDIWKPGNYPKTGAEMRITEMQITDMQNEALTSHNLPVDELRRLAIQASSFMAVVSPATKENPFGDDFKILGHMSAQRHTIEAFVGAPTFSGSKDDYEALGSIWRITPHGKKQQAVAAQFGFKLDWANKHIRIGKKLYPKFFGLQNNAGKKTKTTKAKGKQK